MLQRVDERSAEDGVAAVANELLDTTRGLP
jgi:hypothetical protein